MLCAAAALVWVGADRGHAQDAIDKKVLQLERQFAEAEVKGDAAAIERLEAANYTFTAPDGAVTGKQDDVNDLKSGNFKVNAIDLGDLKVRVYGSVAVVNGKATLKNSMSRGKDISGHYQFTDVWAKVNGSWQVVAGQSALAKQ
jgi:ketosteroid isomerase-like protein